MNANNMIYVVQEDVVVNCVKDSQEISNNYSSVIYSLMKGADHLSPSGRWCVLKPD